MRQNYERITYTFTQDELIAMFVYDLKNGFLWRRDNGELVGQMNSRGARMLTINNVRYSALPILWKIKHGKYPYKYSNGYPAAWNDKALHLSSEKHRLRFSQRHKVKPSIDRLRELLEFDHDTGIVRNRITRGPSKRSDIAGHENPSTGYWMIWIEGRHYRRSHLNWVEHNGCWPTDQIDHINGDRSDDRVENLREATVRENCTNRKRHRNGNLVGALFNKRQKQWRTQIRYESRILHLGYFDDSEESQLVAHNAYMMASAAIERGDFLAWHESWKSMSPQERREVAAAYDCSCEQCQPLT